MGFLGKVSEKGTGGGFLVGLLGGMGGVETEGPWARPLTPSACQVEVFRRQDAERGVRVAQVLEGFISRKVVKQTVMTVVYGVTRYGGRLQIERRLRELSNFPQVRRHVRWVSLRCEGGTVPLVLPAPLAPPNPWLLDGKQPWGTPKRKSVPLPLQVPGRSGEATLALTATPHPSRSSCGRPLTTWCARCSTACKRCSRAPGPSRCVSVPSPGLAGCP